MKPEKLTVEAIEASIKLSPTEWEGNCHAVAIAIVRAKLVKGRVAYGLWCGAIADTGHWAARHDSPFTHHSWIVLPDGRILDPTRWSFEGVSPYIWIGKPTKDYDEGSNRIRAKMMGPAPKYSNADKRVNLKMSQAAKRFLLKLLQAPPAITEKQVFWVANLPPSYLDEFAEDIFGALIRAGYSAFIPMDNRVSVMGEGD